MFTGTLAFTALGGNGTNYSNNFGPLTLTPGQSVSVNFNAEQSHQGGYTMHGPPPGTRNLAQFSR